VLLSLRGGMGTVDIVYDDHWQRLLAIKTPRPAAPAFLLDLFRDEASLLLTLPPHPNVVPVYFFDTWRKVPHLALAAIAGVHGIGETLEHVIARRALMPIEVLTFGLQICDALAHIHDHGLLHLDLKPSNCLRDVQRRVHVTDFGIGRFRAATTGVAGFGTTGYAAPEQLHGGPLGTTGNMGNSLDREHG
jgi:serine/threonine-protein kinase